jgi:formate-nitrite transporter family protein
VREGLDALDRSFTRLFISAISAGLELGLSLLLIAIVKTNLGSEFPKAINELLLANMYSFGFIVVVLGRSELFTEQTTLAILPLRAGKTTLGKVARLWGIVYVGNILGAAACAFLIVVVGPALKVTDRNVFGQIADHVVDFPNWVIFLSAVFAGWLMGLVSWSVAAARETISQIVIIWMLTAAIGLGHMHHVVAGSAEVLGGIFAGSDTTLTDLIRFQFFATLGNAVGGACFVALLKHGHAAPDKNS